MSERLEICMQRGCAYVSLGVCLLGSLMEDRQFVCLIV